MLRSILGQVQMNEPRISRSDRRKYRGWNKTTNWKIATITIFFALVQFIFDVVELYFGGSRSVPCSSSLNCTIFKSPCLNLSQGFETH